MEQLELPPRQLQVLNYLRRGESEKQIARHLSLSPHTVHVYIKALYRRFDVSSLGELLAHWASHDDCPTCGGNIHPRPVRVIQGELPAEAPQTLRASPAGAQLETVSRQLLSLLNEADAAGMNAEYRAEIAKALLGTYEAATRANSKEAAEVRSPRIITPPERVSC